MTKNIIILQELFLHCRNGPLLQSSLLENYSDTYGESQYICPEVVEEELQREPLVVRKFTKYTTCVCRICIHYTLRKKCPTNHLISELFIKLAVLILADFERKLLDLFSFVCV